MYINNKLVIGKNKDNLNEVFLVPSMINRHGLITGASGSGKSTTVKVMAETMSASGIPVFYIDVKGDLASICKAGTLNKNVEDRVNVLGIDNFMYQEFPTRFFDVFEKRGIPIHSTVTNVGSRLLSIMLGLTDAQEGVLAIVFQISKDENFILNDLDDLSSLLSYVLDNREKYSKKYGTITSMTIGSIQRELLVLKQEGGDAFFGKPIFDLGDLIQYDSKGYGYVSVFDARELYKKPTLYGVFLIWLLNNLFDSMPEVGDLDKPKLVLFLDEAHLMFNNMPSNIIKQVTQVVKLIRSKGIGLYFISQTPNDISVDVLAQLSNRVQHVLRSYTPNDEKIIRSVASSFRSNPEFDTEKTISTLGIGEAVISFLNENGEPNILEKVLILPPQSYMGVIDEYDREKIINDDSLSNKYKRVANDDGASIKIASIASNKTVDEKDVKKKKSKKDKESDRILKRFTNKVIDKTTTKLVNSIWKIFK